MDLEVLVGYVNAWQLSIRKWIIIIVEGAAGPFKEIDSRFFRLWLLCSEIK